MVKVPKPQSTKTLLAAEPSNVEECVHFELSHMGFQIQGYGNNSNNGTRSFSSVTVTVSVFRHLWDI